MQGPINLVQSQICDASPPFGPSALRPRFPQLSLAPSVSLDVRVLQDTINLCEIIILCAVVVIMVIIGYGLNIIPYTSWFD